MSEPSLQNRSRTEHLAARPSQHLPGKTLPAYLWNKGPPAVRVRRPGLGAAITRPRRPGSSDSSEEMWPRGCPRGASLPAGSPRPARPPEPSTEHPQVLAFPLVLARQTFARLVQVRGSLAQPGPRGWPGSPFALRPRGFAEPRLQPVSLRRSGLALLSRGRCSCSRSCPPVTRETASPSLPPTNQHRSHGASKPMGDLGIPVLFQGPEPLPRLRDQTGRQACSGATATKRWGPQARESHLVSLQGPFFCGT